MEVVQFRCVALADLVLSVASATEGAHGSLDFIPGGCFLGVAASHLYGAGGERAWRLFHSGKVRFGDAHPSVGGVRGLRVPAALFRPKFGGEERYVHHRVEDFDKVLSLQLKQCRDGFYAFGSDVATQVGVDRAFSIKSAYDAEKRRSEDEKMFGYESIARGTEFLFEVEFDDDALDLRDDVAAALLGERRIGRSRSAQYGLVRIERADFAPVSTDCGRQGEVVVYADGRLVFFDDNGMPTFRPTPLQLGIDAPGSSVVWRKCQVRTFQYAPWNFKRQAFDADRCGIEKGSVFVVETSAAKGGTAYVGAYRNEGFGKVVYNPAFLYVAPGENGRSRLQFRRAACGAKEPPSAAGTVETPLLRFLRSERERVGRTAAAYKLVDEFVKTNGGLFRGEVFASQWGTIRSIAMSSPDAIIERIEDYLGHGVARDKWEERGRRRVLLSFLRSKVGAADLQGVVINLAAEMAKKTRQ